MRRRSFDLGKFLLGLLVVFGALAIFTKILIPFERFVLDGTSSFLWLYYDLVHQPTDSLVSPEGVRIIGRRADEFQTIFLINGSFAEGTKIIHGNVLVGFVRARGDKASKVEAISSPLFKINAILERSGAVVELEGRGAGLLETKVPRGVVVEQGDPVWYDDGHVLLIGRVAKIVDSQSDPFLTIFVEHAINFGTTWFVEIGQQL